MRIICLFFAFVMASAQGVVAFAIKKPMVKGIKIEYSVENNSAYPISIVRIGFVDSPAFPCPMLSEVPLSIESPANWHGRLLDENAPESICDKKYLEWRGADPAPGSKQFHEIAPHSTLRGLSVVIKKDDSAYYTGKFSVSQEECSDCDYSGDIIFVSDGSSSGGSTSTAGVRVKSDSDKTPVVPALRQGHPCP